MRHFQACDFKTSNLLQLLETGYKLIKMCMIDEVVLNRKVISRKQGHIQYRLDQNQLLNKYTME